MTLQINNAKTKAENKRVSKQNTTNDTEGFGKNNSRSRYVVTITMPVIPGTGTP